ncbi:MAG: flagellar motor protein MotA [Alphaproteobacteria bacterium]|nr:flagellar motor protein MotA [Alphaproteobacteria bacterium]
MSYIHRYFLRMLAFLALMGGVVVVLYQPLLAAFKNNVPLNTAILTTLGFGIGLAFFRLLNLRREQLWFDGYERGEERFPDTPEPKILYPLSVSLGESQNNTQVSTLTLRSILSSVESRLEEMRDVSRYLIGLLIFLGLLGTFWGLSQTIGAIAGVITGLEVDATNVKDSFQGLKHGLQAPLMGMGTAFSTSMFGLAGSLILGFLDLQVTKAAGTFYHNLEDHLTSKSKSIGDLISTGATSHGSGQAYSQGLLEQTAECMAQLQNIMHRNEDNRTNVLHSLHDVGEKISMLTEQMVSQQVLLKKMAQGHVDLQKQLENFAAVVATPAFQGSDDGIKQYLRNLDATTLRLLEELIEGRARGIQELRGEIRLVARTISALAEQDAA